MSAIKIYNAPFKNYPTGWLKSNNILARPKTNIIRRNQTKIELDL